MNAKKLCFACDLVDNPELIELYKQYHSEGNTWTEITKSIKDSGIIDMEIYILANRLFMIMEVDETYTPERKQKMDTCQPKSSRMGKINVEISTSTSRCKRGRKMVANGANI